MIRTRVGYAGGSKKNPTYHNLGGHSETIQIDYDPTKTSYEELLEVFWSSHNPTQRSWSRQYASLIFYHDEAQRQLAEESKARQEAQRGRTIHTQIVPLEAFYRAEGYHQKYYLRQYPHFFGQYQMIYPDIDNLVDSTAVARVNGYVGGYGSAEQLRSELDRLGLSAEAEERLLEIVSR